MGGRNGVNCREVVSCGKNLAEGGFDFEGRLRKGVILNLDLAKGKIFTLVAHWSALDDSAVEPGVFVCRVRI